MSSFLSSTYPSSPISNTLKPSKQMVSHYLARTMSISWTSRKRLSPGLHNSPCLTNISTTIPTMYSRDFV